MRQSHIVCILALMVSFAAAARHRQPELPPVAETDSTYSYDVALANLKKHPLHPVEGVWQFTDNGATVAIELCGEASFRAATPQTVYRMVLIESPDRSAMPGSVIGVLRPTAKPNMFSASIYTVNTEGVLCMPRGFLLEAGEVDAGGMVGRLVFYQDKPRLRVNIWNLIPYLYRRVITRNPEPPAVDGCVRVYPLSSKPLIPIYL